MDKCKIYQCPGYLGIMYNVLELSIKEIAESCNMSYGAIWKCFNKFGIKRRKKPSQRTIKKFSISSQGKNNSMYGKKHSEESIKKMKEIKKGNKNPNWKGDNATIRSFHGYLRIKNPPPKLCPQCKKEKNLELSFNHSLKKYTRNIKDYKYLCNSCHLKRDYHEFKINRGFLP